jgi:hypothetical protein
MGLFKEAKPLGWDESFGDRSPVVVTPQSKYEPTQTHKDIVDAQLDVEARKWDDKRKPSTRKAESNKQQSARRIGVAAVTHLAELGALELPKQHKRSVRHLGEFALAA